MPLITTATVVDVSTYGVGNSNDEIVSVDTGANAFTFSLGDFGDDRLIGFGKNDTVLNYKAIYDGNNDGIITFGPNHILDIDRTSSKQAGADQITIQGLLADALRYLGSKDGYHVYADASVRLAGFEEGGKNAVNDNVFNAGGGDHTFFFDTALGLNLGKDTINNFGAGDWIVTTTAIYNGPDGAHGGLQITYGKNGVLDLPGESAGTSGETGPTHGGQIDIVGTTGLYLDHVSNVNGVDYYYYGTEVPAL
jgi:hypothetical protein